jgi:hypothetical protein
MRRVDDDCDSDSQRAFLFETDDGKWLGVTTDDKGAALPAGPGQVWRFRQEFQLGVQHVVPARIDPEPLLRGIKAQGFYVWPVRRLHPRGSNQ